MLPPAYLENRAERKLISNFQRRSRLAAAWSPLKARNQSLLLFQKMYRTKNCLPKAELHSIAFDGTRIINDGGDEEGEVAPLLN